MESNAIKQTELVLFGFTKPEPQKLVGLKPGKNRLGGDDGKKVVGMSIGVMGTRDMAKALQLTQKDSRVGAAILQASDALKGIMLAEVIKLCASQGWTGATMTAGLSKKGVETRGFRFKSVSRPVVTAQSVAEAYAALSDEDRKLADTKALELIKAKTKAIDVQSETQPAAE